MNGSSKWSDKGRSYFLFRQKAQESNKEKTVPREKAFLRKAPSRTHPKSDMGKESMKQSHKCFFCFFSSQKKRKPPAGPPEAKC